MKMVDFLSIIADSFLGKVLNYIVRKFSNFNRQRKNKRLSKNWIDFYRGKNNGQ